MCVSVALAAGLLACGDEGGDRGTATFTTWGEPFIEQQIPADPTGTSGFVDGWTVKYDKFLVVFYDIKLADEKGAVAARLLGSRFVDNVKPGRKTLATFTGVPAQSWNAVSYVIGPAMFDTDVVAGEPADRDMMVAAGYSLYVQGTASKNGMTKTFRWGFKIATTYDHCRQPATSGQPVDGVVITSGGTDVSELTTHGDHLFFDRFARADSAVTPQLRFDAIAAADQPGAGFGEITLDELAATPIPPSYDLADFPVMTLGEFVTLLSRTVAHFRGDGECAFTVIR